MNAADYGIAVGHPADLVVIDSRDPAMAVAELARPLFGYKRGRRSFTHACRDDPSSGGVIAAPSEHRHPLQRCPRQYRSSLRR